MTDPGRLFPGEYFPEVGESDISRVFRGAIPALLRKELNHGHLREKRHSRQWTIFV
jgi:hypothetical protein